MAQLNLNKIKSYLSRQPVAKAWIFGSVARGEDTPQSDIDILVEFDEGVGLFKYGHIARDLEHLLNRTVDLVSESSLFPWVRESVDSEKILIYER